MFIENSPCRSGPAPCTPGSLQVNRRGGRKIPALVAEVGGEAVVCPPPGGCVLLTGLRSRRSVSSCFRLCFRGERLGERALTPTGASPGALAAVTASCFLLLLSGVDLHR